MKRIFILILLIISVLGFSCEFEQEPYTLYADYGKYSFLEINHRVYGQPLEGTHGGIGIDFAPYVYNKNSGELHISLTPAMKTDQIKKADIILGYQVELYKQVGYGSAGSVLGILSFPESIGINDFGLERADSLKILRKNNAGEIEILFRGRNILIKKNSYCVFENEYITKNKIGKYLIKDSIIINNHAEMEREKLSF
jgi:hypothetical protein